MHQNVTLEQAKVLYAENAMRLTELHAEIRQREADAASLHQAIRAAEQQAAQAPPQPEAPPKLNRQQRRKLARANAEGATGE